MAFISTSRSTLAPRASRGWGLRHIIAVWRQRQQLKRLDDRALHDIGISRARAEAEAARPIWDVPATWRS